MLQLSPSIKIGQNQLQIHPGNIFYVFSTFQTMKCIFQLKIDAVIN